jgi:hypothetical protein
MLCAYIIGLKKNYSKLPHGIKNVIKKKFTTSKYTVKLHELVPIIWTKRSVSDSDLEQDPELKRLYRPKRSRYGRIRIHKTGTYFPRLYSTIYLWHPCPFFSIKFRYGQ